MSKVAVVCEPDAAVGFELAGVETLPARNAAEARTILLDCLAGSEYGLLVLDRSLAKGLPPRLQERIFLSNRPLVVTLDLSLAHREEETNVKALVQEMVRMAVGYRINIA